MNVRKEANRIQRKSKQVRGMLYLFECRVLLPQGGTLIFHTYVNSGLFLGSKFLNINIFWGFSKNVDIFWGYEDFVDIFWGSSQNWTIFRGYFYAF